MTCKPFAALCFAVLAAPAFGHHGRRFLFVTEFRMPHPGQIYAIGDFSGYRFNGGGSSLSSEPGVLVAVGNQSKMAFEIHSHINKDGGSPWDLEAVGFEFRTRIGNDVGRWGFTGGLEVEAPAHRGPTPVTAELIGGHEDGNGVWAFNLFASNDEGLSGKTTWIYRTGYSPDLPGPIGWSIEAQGTLNRDSAHEVALGAAMSVGESKLLKLGLGKGFGPGSANLTFHLGVVLRLK